MTDQQELGNNQR